VHARRVAPGKETDHTRMRPVPISLEELQTIRLMTGRLQAGCTERGYHVAQLVNEIVSGVNDSRPKLFMLLKDPQATRIVVENHDRLAQFGYRSLETLLELEGRMMEVESAG
jgi:DNA invertase Pin-like site-specific DNA recombinase